MGGRGGGVCNSPAASKEAQEKGRSNWKTSVMHGRSGDEEEDGSTEKEQGALKGELGTLWAQGDWLRWEMEEEEDSVHRSLMVSSNDFCSREMSEVEKLSQLQTRKHT